MQKKAAPMDKITLEDRQNDLARRGFDSFFLKIQKT